MLTQPQNTTPESTVRRLLTGGVVILGRCRAEQTPLSAGVRIGVALLKKKRSQTAMVEAYHQISDIRRAVEKNNSAGYDVKQ